MKKYDYMKESQYYKQQQSLLRRYRSATNREDKAYARALMKKTWEQAEADRTVPGQKKQLNNIIKKVNERMGEEILNTDNIAYFFDFANNINATMMDVFFDSDEIIVRNFKERVINKKQSVDDAINSMREAGIII